MEPEETQNFEETDIDEEIDDDGDEISPRKDSALPSRLDQGIRGHFRRQRHEVIGEIEPARDRADHRHQEVADQRVHDGAERGAEDHAHREIDDIAADCEFLEVFEHGQSPVVRFRPDTPASSRNRPLAATAMADGPFQGHTQLAMN